MLADVGPEHIRPYVHESTRERGEKSLTPASRHKRYRHVKVFLRWCLKAGHLTENPLKEVEEPDKGRSIPAYLTADELDRLLEYIDWHAKNKPNACGILPDLDWLRDAILLAVCTGLRRGELLNLRWEDVDLKGRRIYVRNRDGFRTKSGSERVVPVRGPAFQVLRRLEDVRPADSGPVLLDRRGKPLRSGRLSRRFKDMVRAAKVKGRERLRFHSLRHTTGAWLASKGVSARIIQEILGHATPVTTEIYSHIAGPAVEDAMERVFGE
ncbi:MAG: tyrosine-type recombinase/integrase [Bacteroidetes bacterium]|jgi:integrase|nr:tyrosine-type recombinase/integrase [Bacteroidota bacterium]